MTLNLLSDLLKFHDELILRDRVRTDLLDWATTVMHSVGLTPSAHHRYLLKGLDLLSSGHIKRLMVLMPPGSAKSTYVSVVFPVWWFTQYPASAVIAVSHTASLVQSFSRRAQTLIEEHEAKLGFGLASGARATMDWKTTTGGEYFATGVHGAITGRRADLLIIDDPIKSIAEADSPRHRQRIWDWYTAELSTRLKPNARVALVMTRWHEHDLGGELLSTNSDEWTVLSLPALAVADDPMGRPEGAPIWPDWEDLAALTAKRTLVGPRIWSALFQQSPTPDEGSLFETSRFLLMSHISSDTSEPIRTVRAWDLAGTAAAINPRADWTVGLRLSHMSDDRYIVEDIVRLRGSVTEVRDKILSTARTDGHSVIVSLPIDPGQAGLSQVSYISSLLPGYRVYTSREQGTKYARATPVAAQIAAGNVAAIEAGWNREFIAELKQFPNGDNDDQVDALSRAFSTIAELGKGVRRINISMTSR